VTSKPPPSSTTRPSGDEQVAAAVARSTALAYWLRLGFTNFGGPAGQIAMMHRDLVVKRKWISEERFLHALNYCMLLPGPEAQQLAIYIGLSTSGVWGGLVAGALFVLPSVAILWGLSAAYAMWGSVPGVVAVLAGIKPVVVALVLSAVIRIGRRSLSTIWLAAIAAGSFAALFFARVPFPLVLLSAATISAAVEGLARRRARERESGSEKKIAARDRRGLAGGWLRVARILAAGCVLWAVPFALVLVKWGPRSLFAEEYRFFTKAAFVTFGGAYAVLAYATHAAVDTFGWITHAQAVDGMGLAETTPGPLIMVLQFVGFMAAWNHPAASGRLASATVGALLTTWVTFLPSFVFVFLGAPYIERLRERPALAAALRGVGAAVVGVILELGVVFGIAVLFPGGPSGARSPDLFAIAVAAVSFAVLVLTRVEGYWLVLAGAAAGLLKLWGQS
jgi:chromate transporter